MKHLLTVWLMRLGCCVSWTRMAVSLAPTFCCSFHAPRRVSTARRPPAIFLSSEPPPEVEPEAVKTGANKLSRFVRLYHMVRPVIEHGLMSNSTGPNRNRLVSSRRQRRRWTNSNAFHGLIQWAFNKCDTDENGQISRKDLYTGVLLVHLHLAKYIGIAACQPLSRTQVDELFDIAASKSKGRIGIKEFEDIAILSCTRISSRVFIYWAVLVALVPFLTNRLICLLRKAVSIILVGHDIRYLPWLGPIMVVGTWLAEHVISVAAFTVVVPMMYGKVDEYYAKRRRKRAQKRVYFPAWEAFREKYMQLAEEEEQADVEDAT